MTTGKQHFLALDGLRGVAALCVVWGHLFTYAGANGAPQHGMAVDFFFMLSGYVVAYAYGERLRGGMGFVEFVKVRLIRLYPLMFLGALLGGLMMVMHVLVLRDVDWWRAWSSIGLAFLGLPSLLIAKWPTAFPINGPSWSLTFELLINFLYAPVARFLSQRALVALTIVTAVIYGGVCLWLGRIEMGFDKHDVWGGLPRVAFGFTCGLMLHGLKPLPRLPESVALLIAAALVFLLCLPAQLSVHWQLGLIMIAFPPAIMASAAVQPGPRLAKLCRFLGDISYPIYILHAPIARGFNEVTNRIDPQGQWWALSFVVQLVLLVIISWLALKAIDTPVRRWLTSMTRRPKPAAAEAAATS